MNSSVMPSPIALPTPGLPDPTMPLVGDWSEALHEPFVRQAKRVPHKTAIVGHAVALSYAELEHLSNRLAHYLCAHDCSGKVVAIYAERSPTIVWAILGVLKAGAAFVILDAAYPAARLAEYCRQAKPSALLQLEETGPLPDLVATVTGSVCLTLPKCPVIASQALNAYTAEAPAQAVDPKQLAYIMFTSGSTGKPKGIMGDHAPPAHFMAWHRNTFGFTEADRFSMFSGLGHDPLLRDIFTPLSLGATLYIPTADDLVPGRLSTWMSEQQITVAHLTPPMGQLISANETVLVRLRYLFFGGDKLPTALVEKLHQLAPHVTCVNFYGASETPQAMAYFVVPRSEINSAVVPIGRGIQDVQLFVLTDDLQLAGNGEVGEIAIRTPYLALGYLEEQPANSPKFITNPFTRQEGDRIYRTGDRGRYLPDNNVEILGRRDQQVQLRGYRIELSEIEAALNAHPAVEQSVIVLREQAQGNYLVAYVVVSAPITEWRAYLSAQLPDYMLPNALLPVARFPLTPNGKIDLSALLALTLSGESFVAPRTPTEARLAALWSEVLGLEAVGLTDDFLALGGHSLLAMQLIARVRDAFGIELPLRWLFDARTIATLASHIEKAQNQSAIEHHALPAITSAVRGREHPLSFSQQRFWLLAQMQPEGQRGLYNIYRMVRLIGPLDVEALSQSFSLLVRRHESLRTSFEPVDGQPTQLIHPPFAVSVPVVDLTSMGREEQASAIQRLASETAQSPFDLATAPLWRVQLVQLDTHEYLLLFVIHHIVSDGWSMRLLFSDLSVLYDAHLHGESAPLSPLAIQYIDYTDWQRTIYQSETLRRQLAYWKAQLAGAWPILDLPRDYPVSTGQTFTTQTLSLTLPDSLREALQVFSRQEGATSFMTLLAAFKTLLYRYTGQVDLIVGTPIAGRTRAEVEKLIGCFINTLALRTDLSGNPSFREVLRRVRQVALSAYAHQELPFEKLIEELPSLRNVNGAPLFRAWFNMLPNENPLILAGLRSETLDLVEEPSLFDLSLYVSAMDKLKLTLLYNSDLFSEARMRLLLTHLQSLLEGIVAAPDAPIGSYRLPPGSGQNRVQPTNLFIEFPLEAIEQSIPARFVAQVRRAPDQLAIKTKRYAWSYQELNQRADQLAQALLVSERGAGRIALLFEHDAPMVAAMLGVLKAGKTYVALDPFYPQARLLYMLADAEVQAIVTNNQNLAYAQELTGGTLRLINLDQPSALPPCPGWDEEAITLAPDTLAYILYTSGSTGQPKGVMQSHRNVLHFMRTYTNNLHIAPSDKLTLLSSYSFDAAIMDIWGALLNGATLYPFDLKQNSLAELATCLRAEGITIYHSTPTVYRQLMKTLTGAEDFPQLRLIVMGGEAVYKPDVELYKKHFADACLFVNGLGPTESTVTLQYFINKQTDVPRHAVPVGYPVDQTAIVLLDEAGQETDLYGEIAIRSEHVALGYWRKEAQSARVFLPDPTGGKQRLYRMGDWGRYLPDGSLEFVGRKDSQVKIRGYRIELGEIESALSQHPAVKESAVILLDDTPAEQKQLVAYVVLSEAVAAIDLRAFMGQKLPSYMVPQAYIQLAALPQTPTGKIDRRALPAPALSAESAQNAFVAPRTPTEEQIAAIWREVLKTGAIGIHDNFFALGGHSLLAVQVISRVRQALAADLSLRQLFETPTVAELAEKIKEANKSSRPPIRQRLRGQHGVKRSSLTERSAQFSKF